FPSVYTYVPVVPTRRQRSIVVAIHDVIAERFPQHVFKNARARLFWKLKTWLAVAQATRILTVSEHAKLGVQNHFHVAPEKIRVTHEAAARTFQPIEPRATIDAAFARLGIAAG